MSEEASGKNPAKESSTSVRKRWNEKNQARDAKYRDARQPPSNVEYGMTVSTVLPPQPQVELGPSEVGIYEQSYEYDAGAGVVFSSMAGPHTAMPTQSVSDYAYYTSPPNNASPTSARSNQQSVEDPYMDWKLQDEKHLTYKGLLQKNKFRVSQSKEFIPGRILKIFWFKKGGKVTNATKDSDEDKKDKLTPELSKAGRVRRFVVIDTVKGHSIAIPVNTYGLRGTLKPGCHPEDHALIFTPPQPNLLDGEELSNPSIVVATSKALRHEELHPASRVNYAKQYIIEHNWLVNFFGKISDSSSNDFWRTLNSVENRYKMKRVEGLEPEHGGPQSVSASGVGPSAERPATCPPPTCPPGCAPITQNPPDGGSSMHWLSYPLTVLATGVVLMSRGNGAAAGGGDVRGRGRTSTTNNNRDGRQIDDEEFEEVNEEDLPRLHSGYSRPSNSTQYFSSANYGDQEDEVDDNPHSYASNDRGTDGYGYYGQADSNNYSEQVQEQDRSQSSRRKSSRSTPQSRSSGQRSKHKKHAQDRPRRPTNSTYSYAHPAQQYSTQPSYQTMTPLSGALVSQGREAMYSSQHANSSAAVLYNKPASQSSPEPRVASAPVSPPAALKEKKLNVLSLDGGGVRGLSSLLILKDIMARLNRRRKTQSLPPVKPYQVFDLIGGTSTGGIIAIMLGRLKMDVEDCIKIYTSLFSTIFDKTKERSRFSLLTLQVNSRFDAAVLVDGIKTILRDMNDFEEEEVLMAAEDAECKVAVCTVLQSNSSPTLIRSYTAENPLDDINAKIWQAARATSAATSFFDPIEIDNMWFVDGAMGANNPVYHIFHEATNIWCENEAELPAKLNCFLSIGTGDDGGDVIQGKSIIKLVQTLKSIAVETRETARQFAEGHAQLIRDGKYYRFNVVHGVGDIELEDYTQESRMRGATKEYMKDERERSIKCARTLASQLGP